MTLTPDLQRALNALYLEAPASVVNDIKARVEAALAMPIDPLAAFKQPIKVLDQGFVRLVAARGGEADILQAARVTSGAGSKGPAEDRGLLRYLMRHRHSTPLEFASIVLHVRVPMDVWRQWIRHRTAVVNEYSTRYSEAINAMATTDEGEWRRQAVHNRQGSDGDIDEETWPEGYRIQRHGMGACIIGPGDVAEELDYDAGFADTPGGYLSKREQRLHDLAREVYQERLAFGVAKEQARKDLPLSNYTEAYWSINLHNLLHFLGLRLDEHAQLEIRLYAQAIADIVAQWVPNIWEAFVDYRLDAHTFSRQEMVGVRALVQKALEDEELLAESDNVPFDRLDYVVSMLPGLPKRELDAFMKAVEIK